MITLWIYLARHEVAYCKLCDESRSF